MERTQPPSILQANLLLVGTIVIGLLLATFLGATLGESEFMPLLLIGGGLAVGLFAVGLYRYVWHAGLFLLFFGFSYRPTGFTFGALELGCALGAATIALFFWQKRTWTPPPFLAETHFKFLRRAVFVWLVYVALHMVYNIKVPQRPSEFALNNAIKSYFAVSAPLVLLLYFSKAPAGLIVRKDFFWTIARLAFAALILNLGIRFYEIAGGAPYIPVIRAVPSPFTLRFLASIAMALGVAGLTDPWRRRTLIRFFVYWSLIIAGAIGGAVSGGRATLMIGLFSTCGVLLMRRKIVALFIMLVVGILCLAAANLRSDWINAQANPYVQRSLQWALIHKKGEAVVSIENSSDWRREVFNRAIDEWKSEPRIFWTGRATYGFGVADETAILIAGGYKAVMESAVRRGATHNLISDLLIAYGLIGLVLYLTVTAALLWFLWKLTHVRQLSPPAANLALVTLITSVLWFVYALIGGNFYPTECVWFVIILIGAFYSGAGIEERRKPLVTPRVPHRAPEARIPMAAAQRRLVRANRL